MDLTLGKTFCDNHFASFKLQSAKKYKYESKKDHFKAFKYPFIYLLQCLSLNFPLL